MLTNSSLQAEVEREARRKKVELESLDPKREEAARVVSMLFPDAPARLIRGVARIARLAADERAAIQSLLNRLEPPEETTKAISFDDDVASQGFNEFVLKSPRRYLYS